MESSFQAVMLFHNFQATAPFMPAPLLGATKAFYMAVPVQEPPPAEPEPEPAPEKQSNG